MNTRCCTTDALYAVCTAVVLLAIYTPAYAQRSAAVREAAEYVMKKFGKEAAEETTETITTKLTALCAKHGDEAIEAVKRVGPRTFKLVEEAGEHGPSAIKLMIKHGDDAAWVISRPNRLAIFIQHGDDAAEAMIKHKDIVVPLIERYHGPAARAFKAVNGQNARRLAMMEDAGELAAIGKTDEVLGVIARYGDGAADFVWRNKGALAAATALAAFLSDPEPFLTGARELAKEPLQEVARRTNWTAVLISGIGGVVLLLVVALWRHRTLRSASDRGSMGKPS